MSTPRAPLLMAALAFAGGILAGQWWWRPPIWWAIAAVWFLASAAWLLRQKPRCGYACGLGAMLALGALAIQARQGEAANTLGARDLGAFVGGQEVTVTARVMREGMVRAGAGERREFADVETEEIADGAGLRPAHGGIRLTVYSHEDSEESEGGVSGMALPELRYGQRLTFTAKLRWPSNFDNPGAWDHRAYLPERGITATAAVRADRIERLPGFGGSRLELWRSQVRRSVLDHVHALWQGPRAGLMDAMLIGEKSFINRDTRQQFQRTGVFHILVVSGMNVGIMAFVVFWVLKRLRLGAAWASLATVLLSGAYAYLTDAGAPILRATLMLAVYLGTRLLYRERALLNAVGTAALVLLVVDPKALLDASFQLSFLSVVAIAGIAVPLLERTSQPYRQGLRNFDSTTYDLTLAPRIAQFRLDLRLVAARLSALLGRRLAKWSLLGLGRVLLSVWEVFVITTAVNAALALPMAVYFHRATTLALVANAIVVPLTGVLMPAASLAVALSYLSPVLAKLPALAAAWSLDGITESVRLLGGLRAADVRVATPVLAAALAAAAAVAAAVMTARKRPLLAYAGLAGLLGAGVWIAAVPPRAQWRSGALEVTALDVGQADSTLIVTPEGKTLLVDAAGTLGPWQSEFDFGEDVIAPYLWSRGITRLDAVALTHAHADHIGGMRSVVTTFHPRQLWMGPNAMTPALAALLREAAAAETEIVRRRAGESFPFGGTEVRVFSPPPGWQPAARPRNNDSLVMRIKYGDSAVLLAGDAEKKMEPYIAAQEPRALLLKVAHNGSMTSTTAELLRAVNPRYAVISVGAHNAFRHPREEVLARLAESGVRTFRTDTGGAITFYLDGQGVTPLTMSCRR